MSQKQDNLITKKVRLLRKDPQKAREEYFSDMTDREFDRMFKYVHQHTEDSSDDPVKKKPTSKEEEEKMKESFRDTGKMGRLREIIRKKGQEWKND